MKQTKHILLTLAALLCSLAVSAHDFEVNGIYYNITSSTDLTVAVTYRGSYYEEYSDEYKGVVTIPSKISYNGNSYNVTTIGGKAFRDCSSLTSITLSEGMTSIESWAFRDCSSLTSITIPESVISIGGEAFWGCSSLTSITFPASVTSIGKAVFRDCSSLTSITMAEGNTVYDSREGCNAIIETESNTLVQGCGSTTIPEGVTIIGYGAFEDCSSLTAITLPESVTSIGDYAFNGCTNLVKVINYSNLKINTKSKENGYVGYYANKIIQGEFVTTVGDFQFITSNGSHYLVGYIGSNIESITLPDKYNGENYIVDSYALYGPEFKSVTVGSGVLKFNTNVYNRRPTKVIWLTNTPPTSWENGSGVVNYSSNGEISSSDNTFPYLSSMFEVDGVKYVMLSPKERTCVAIDCAYNNTAENIVIGKTVTNKNISFTVTEVKPYAFYKNNYITEVSVEHNGNIGECAFLGCQSIQKIEVANQGSIGREAFLGCTAKTINVSNHGAIADLAFYQCSGMESISISNKGVIGSSAFSMSKGEETNVTISNAGNIGQNAFCGYAGMKSVNISNVGEVGQGAFKDCIDLQTVKVENIGRVESEAFYNCSSLAVASLGEDVSALGDYAFYGCTTLSNIVIPNTVQKVGSYCFYGCSAMENAFIGTGVTKTEDYTFAECTNLKHIEIGKNVTEIGQNAFYNCKSLLEVNLPEGTKTIKESAFENCEAIAEINIPQATETIDKNVFKGCKNLSEVIIKDRTTALNLSYCYSNGVSTKNPLFVDCPLDSVYIGGKIVYSTAEADGHSPFYNNKTLRTVVIANGEDNIYGYEFAYCSNLQHISIGNDVTDIGTYAFASCTSLPTITIPSSTTKINDYAFYKCSKLADVIIADRTGTIYLGHNGKSPMFVDCPLDSVYIGGKITYSIVETNGYSPFYRNTSLRTVHVTHNEVTIYENEFYGCTGLKNVYIGNGVTSIGDYAFSGCSALISFSFGKSMETIGKEAFSDCTSMVDLTSCATEPPICGNQALADINVWDCILHVPSGCADAYYDADQWDGFFFIEEDGIQTEYYTLTYMVDGKVYKAETYAAGATVTMLVPTKEGYVFSGWNNVITTMPNENVIVTGTFVQKEMVTQVVVTITLSQTTATLTEGETMTLTATIAPEDATDKSITWSSSNTTVATVDANGKVTAIATGTATITAAANDGSGVTAACEVTVLAYDNVTFMVDGEVYHTDVVLQGNSITLPEAPEKEGYMFAGWKLREEGINIKDNADDMLYSNAPCTETQYGDQFVGWHVLFDGDANTIFHTEYSNRESADGLDHYLRVDMGEGNSVSNFTFTYTVRAKSCPYTPTRIVVEGSDEANGHYTKIAELTDLPCVMLAVYKSPVLRSGKAYRYIRYRVTETDYNVKVYGHPYFYFAEFGMARVDDIVYEALYVEAHNTITINQYGSGTYCSEYALDFSEVEGLKAYAATGYNNITGVVTLTRVMTAQPGEGLFIKGEPGKYMVPVMESTGDHTTNMLKGTLAKTGVNKTSDDGLYANYKYSIKEGDTEPKFYQFANGSTMGAGKAYLQIPTAWLPAGETRSIGLRFDEGEGTTDIDASTLNPQRSTEVYDLYGRRVTQPVKGALYIVNGRKVVY